MTMDSEMSRFLIEDRTKTYEYTPIGGDTSSNITGAIIHRNTQEFPQEGIGTRIQMRARICVPYDDFHGPANIGDVFLDSDGYAWSVMAVPTEPSLGLWWIEVELVALTHKAHSDRIR